MNSTEIIPLHTNTSVILKLICISLWIFIFLFSSLFCSYSFAQSTSTGLAVEVTIPGNNVKPGSIVSLNEKNYKLSSSAYDPTAVGVIVSDPSLVLENTKSLPKNSYAIVSEGKTYVRVSSNNGKIAPGDLLTTSSIPGVAQKATQDGNTIGIALDSYDNSNKNKDGLILTSLSFIYFTNPEHRGQNLFGQIQRAFTSEYLGPGALLRYVTAALIVIISFALGLGYFGRVVTAGVESLGRNPLASKVIMASIILNLVLMLAVLGTGIAISYIILVI